MKAITLGVHVVDVLARPVSEIPAGQGGAARRRDPDHGGRAGRGHRRHAGQARCRGAQRRRDRRPTPWATCCSTLLGRAGVDTSLLVRREEVQTSASVLPIRPDGSRPGVPCRRRQRHLLGRRRALGRDRAAPPICTSARLSSWAARRPRRSSSFARQHGVITSADILAPGRAGGRDPRLDRPRLRAPRLPAAQRRAGARAVRRRRSRRRVPDAARTAASAASRPPAGADGAVVVSADGRRAGSRVRGRRRRHHRLRRRLLGRLPARPGPRPVPPRGGDPRLRGAPPWSPPAWAQRPRRLRPRGG